MLKKLVLMIAVVCMGTGLLFAEPTMAVLPSQGRGPAGRLAGKLTEELKLVYRTIRGAVAVEPEKVMPVALLREFEKCGTNRRCVEELSSKVSKADLVLLPLITSRKDGATTVNLYIYSTQGRQVARYVVKVEPGSDEEDIAADVAAALMTVSSDIASSPGSFADDDDDEPAVADSRGRAPEREPARDRDRDRGDDRRREPPAPSSTRLSAAEARTVLRNGFKAYKGGDVDSAMKMFSEAGDSKLAQEAEDVAALIVRSRDMIENSELDRAVESLKRAEKIDSSIRERGYKELQFIRETTRRDRYNEPKEADFRKVDALFREIRKEIAEVAQWRKAEIDKAERSIGDQLRERERVNREFEQNEEKQREKERNEERDHKKKIEDMKSSLAGLDAKYREKIMDSEKEIGSLNRRLDDQRPAEERFRKEIEQEMRELEKKRKVFEVGLRREVGLARKNARIAEDKAVKAAEAAFKKMEDTLRDLDRKLASTTKEIEKANADFDRNEQRENQIFERSVAKAEEQDRKDIEEAERLNAKEVAAFNREFEDYDKKLNEAAQKIDAVDREIADYIEKQDVRIQKSQELANRNREELERKFDGQRRAAENKAEEEYRRGQTERSKRIEALERQILSIEEKNVNYDKDPQWNSLRKQLRAAMDDLVKYEENHVKFIEEKIAPAVNAHQANIKKLEAAFQRLEATVKKEIAAYTKTKNVEKTAATKELKVLEAGKGRFEATIRKKIDGANAARDRKVKEIEARVGKRDAERQTAEKQRRAAFEKQIAARRNEFAATEKQMAAVSAQGEKLRIDSARNLEQLKITNEKTLSALEISLGKRREAQEIAFEKERIALYDKYEKMAEAEKKKIIVQIDQIEKEMRALLVQRGKEEAALRANIENTEKQTDVMYNRWENEGKQRRVVLERDLAAAEKRENAAKAKLEALKKNIENQYNQRVEAIINSAARKLGSSDDKFTVERDRTYEFSAQTRAINSLVANSLSNMGNQKLQRGDIAGARKDFYEAIYYESGNKQAGEGLKAMSKKIADEYEQASKIMNEDPQSARRILTDLRKNLEPDDPYYLKTLALLEELR